MKILKLTILGTATALVFIAPLAMAAEQNHRSYNAESSDMNRPAMQNYLNYEAREPCQNYRIPPAGYYFRGCDLVRRQEKIVERAETAAIIEPAAGNEMAIYRINFSYDKSAIEPSAKATLDQIAYDIQKYKPREVTISGFTDTAGSSYYNERLSERRADSVSLALNNLGVASRIMGLEAYGENNLAVDTNDGVPLRENRRALIKFLK